MSTHLGYSFIDMSEPYTPAAESYTYASHPLSGSTPARDELIDKQTCKQTGQPGTQHVQSVDLQRQKIDGIHAEIKATKDVLHENIELITERGETLEHLDQRTHDLSIHSQSFRAQAQSTRRKFWWKNIKWTIAIGIIFVLILGGVIAGAIKGTQ